MKELRSGGRRGRAMRIPPKGESMIQKFPRQLVMLLAAMALAVALPRPTRGRTPRLRRRATADADQARRGVVSRKHFVRPLLWDVSVRDESGGGTGIPCRPNTPRANNLLSGGLLDQNPNTTQPFRLDRTCPLTTDQNHDYTPEQKAFDHGLMDTFLQVPGPGEPVART